MTHSRLPMHTRNPLCFAPSLVLAATALALSSGLAQAATLKPISISARAIPPPSALALSGGRAEAPVLKPVTISAPVISAPAVRTIGYDSATDAPIEEVTARARVRFNPVILTTHSGAALLHDDVADAARRACESIDPLDGNEACVRRAIESAQPQVTTAIALARGTEMG